MPGFSRMYPRSGQWVMVDGKRVGVAISPDDGGWKLEGDVVVSRDIPELDRPRREWPPVRANIGTPTGKWLVEVLYKSGLRVDRHLVIGLDRLTPVMSREQIPAQRLATYDPKWEPSP